SASENFRCLRRHHQTGSAACVSCSGTAVEDAVAQQLLQAIAPQAIDAAIAAAQRVGERHREQRQALQLELEQARYDAQLAARRYEHVDPEKRLVAAELETRWNAALERVREGEARLASFEARTAPAQQVHARALPA